MSNRRDTIIKTAIMEKLGFGMGAYTADDILAVANIGDDAIQQISDRFKDTVAQTVADVPVTTCPTVTNPHTTKEGMPTGKKCHKAQ